MPIFRRTALVACAAAAIAVSACSPSNYDAEATEITILTEFAGREGTKAEAVACPIEVPLEKGQEFTCDVLTEDSDRIVVNVTLEADSGKIKWEVSGDQVDTKDLEAKLAAAIDTDLGVKVTIECPGTLFAGVGDSFDCDATDSDGVVTPVIVTIDDSEAGFTYEILRD